MYKQLSILALLAVAHGQEGGGVNNDSEKIFGKLPGPSTLVPADASNDEVERCKTKDNQDGECVWFYQCHRNNNTIITDGYGIIEIRLGGPCKNYYDLCCLVSDKRPPDNPITPTPNPDEPARVGCGWANPKGANVRTTGDFNGETKFGEFPWMVGIIMVEPARENEHNGQNVYVGGGSLIHPSVVLTAAHYVAVAKQFIVRAGEWDTQNTKEIYPFQDRDVKSKEIHKDFNKGNLFYDVALLFLSKPMDLAPHIGLACLPPSGEKTPARTRCFATGWGKDKFGKEGQYQVMLKKIEVPVVHRNTCQDQLRRTRLGRRFMLHSSFMCAGGEAGKDSCTGDGGAPLSCPIEFETDRYQQSGIVAWGIGCGKDSIPGVYVDVAYVRDWIDDKVKGKGYDISVYKYLN